MIKNKEGKIIANTTQPIHVFESKTDFDKWKADNKLTDDDLKKMMIIKQYMYAPGCYVEADTLSELAALSDENKIPGILYGVRATNKLYRWDTAIPDFVEMGA